MHRRAAFITATMLFALWLNNTSLCCTPADSETRLIAHRGVHQIYAGNDRTSNTCRAKNIRPLGHDYIENTLNSMQAAFAYGADVVEVDVHLTTDNIFAVFHDWRLECQTNGRGVTNQQSFEYLKQLDLGYGFTTDGKLFPLRGNAKGHMPSLTEVLNLEVSGQYLINFKSNREKEGTALIDVLEDTDTSGKLFGVYGGALPTRAAAENMEGLRGLDRAALVRCLVTYMLTGWTGIPVSACKNSIIGIPINYAPLLWGWPHKFTARMQRLNSVVILWGPYDGSGFSSGIDSIDQLAMVPDGFSGYVWTNRVELLGPVIKGISGDAVNANNNKR